MQRTKSGLPKHCSWNTDRHGKRRVRFRKSGFTTYLTGLPYSPDFMAQYWAAYEGVKKKTENIGAELRTKPGSFNELCVSYYRSPDFLDIKDITKADYRGIIENFRRLHGDKPVAKLQRQHVKDIIAAKANTPAAANALLKVLRAAAEPRGRPRHDRRQSGHRRQALQGSRRRLSHLERGGYSAV